MLIEYLLKVQRKNTWKKKAVWEKGKENAALRRRGKTGLLRLRNKDLPRELPGPG